MKLYATTTSERASKGQGGNQFIETVLSVGSADDSRVIAKIVLTPEGEQRFRIVYSFGNEKAGEIVLNSKGERQEGESEYGCIYDHDHGDGSKCEYHSL